MAYEVVPNGRIDVHQHLWPNELIEVLRNRFEPPYLRGWTLHVAGYPAYEVNPADHNPTLRAQLDADAAMIGVALSAGLGVHDLFPSDAEELLTAWHAGAKALGAPFAPWAAATRIDPDLIGLAELLTDGFIGLEMPATWLATPRLLEEVAPLLAVCETAGVPVLVHPAASTEVDLIGLRTDLPGWWPPVVDYTAQLQAAWWSWHEAGRSLLPDLRLCFVGGAGLAPLHEERYKARGGPPRLADTGVFADTSSYGPRALGALVGVLGIDALVFGSDRPYSAPSATGFYAAADDQISVTNPRRLLRG